MVEINEANMIERMIYSINDFKDEMVKSINYIREDMSCMRGDIKILSQDVYDLKGRVTELKSELRDYKEENNRRWEENEKRWEKYEENRKKDKKELFDILHNYDIAISTMLGDPNAEKMRKII